MPKDKYILIFKAVKRWNTEQNLNNVLIVYTLSLLSREISNLNNSRMFIYKKKNIFFNLLPFKASISFSFIYSI